MKFLSLLFVCLLFACKQQTECNNAQTVDSLPVISKTTKADENKSPDPWLADSIYVKAKADSIISAIKQKSQRYFHTKYDSLNVFYGHVFSPSAAHVLINAAYKDYNHIFIFNADGKGFNRVFYTKVWFMNYRGDSIADINGDGYKDYLVKVEATNHTNHIRANWCVNIYNPASKGFAKTTCFMNPVFYPKEKVVRGVTYGRPGDVELYKIRWVGIVPDTVEYIHRIEETDKLFVRTIKDPWYDTEAGIIISAIPAEYKSLPEFGLFTADPVY